MRVIAGTAKGHTIHALEGLETRPTSDRLKETLFNILSPKLNEGEIYFLDLFSGTGAIGIEALSRGAEKAVFVELNKPCVDLIKQNLQSTKLADRADVLNFDYLKALDILGSERAKFDLIFLDPPYNKGFVCEALKKIVSHSLLKDDGIIVAEQGTSETTPDVSGLEVFREKQFKTTKFIFLSQIDG